MAPLSNSMNGSTGAAGLPRAGFGSACMGLWSTMAGMRLFGATLRNAGSNCAPLPISTGTRRYFIFASSRNIVILWPFGVVQ